MNFFRHEYIDSYDIFTEMLYTYTSFGFIRTDNDESLDNIEQYYNKAYRYVPDIYWPDDTDKQHVISDGLRTAKHTTDNLATWQYHGPIWHNWAFGSPANANSVLNKWHKRYSCIYFCTDATYERTNPPLASGWGGSNNATNRLFFTRLKNNGFLINLRLGELNSGSYSRKETPAMTFAPIIGGDKYDYVNYAYYSGAQSRIITIIGIPPTTKSILNEYMYIHSDYCVYQSGNTNAAIWENFTDTQVSGNSHEIPHAPVAPRPMFDFLHGKCLFEIPTYSKSYSPYRYNMDFNPNVCVLTKYPYDNGFIDNLYIMTTCPNSPTQGPNINGAFFSFNGRNFINIYNNLVLELPGY